jgi:SSS family solute:Na+ symporter
MALGFILLSMGFAGKLRSFNVVTTAELFEVKYGSTFLRKAASILSALSLCGIVAGLVIGTRGTFLALGISQTWVLLLFWLFIIGYTMLGGLRAVVLTDIFQVGIILIVFVGVFLYSLSMVPISWDAFRTFTDTYGKDAPSFSFARIFSFFLMPALMSLVEQDLAQRFFAARTKAIALWAALASAVILIIFSLIPVYFGMKARLLGLVVPAGAQPIISFFEQTTSDIVMTIFMVGIFAAVTSTADSLLCAIGSNLAQDFGVRFSTQRRQLFASQIITGLSGVAALLIAYFFDNVLEMFSQSYELLVSTLLISILFCFFAKRVRKEAAFASLIAGLIGFIVFRLYPIPLIPREAASLVLSFVGYLAGMAVGSSVDKER